MLRNDGALNRTYKSVEVEWMIPFTRRFTFGGNYTFARLMSNTRNNVDNPARSNTFSGNSINWASYWSTYLPQNQGNVDNLRLPQHTVKWYMTYDLTQGKVKSSLGVLGSYTSGMPMSRSFNYSIPYPTVPGYHDGSNSQTGGLPTYVTQYMNPGMFTNRDIWGMNLTYNMEIPVVRTLVWFINCECDNFLNIRTLPQYTLPVLSSGQRDPLGQSGRNPYGYQLATSGLQYVGAGGINYAASNGVTNGTTGTTDPTYFRQGLRTLKLQTGLRF